MSSLRLLKFPDPRLRKVSSLITEITPDIHDLAKKMLEVMYDEPGLGLAAPQLDHFIRLIVIDTDWMGVNAAQKPSVLINPEIVFVEGVQKGMEGCLSVPGLQAEIERHAKIQVNATTLNNEKIQIEATGIRSVCLQHEIDHLNGMLFIDRLSRLKRDLYIKRLKKNTPYYL